MPENATKCRRNLATALRRHAVLLRWMTVVLVVLGLFLVAQVLPVDRLRNAFRDWIVGLGLWGALVFVLIYVAATLLFVPGSLLTLAAGAIFGLVEGTLLVSIASTTTAALAFLIARYLARDRVARRLAAYPKFRAIDQAIGDGGWKIVALLRLSPAVPFTLQNYLYGLTPIRFGPYLLTSWLTMLPGTFLYIYLGYLGGAGLEAAAGNEGRAQIGIWILRGVGLAATVAVTVYITYRARRVLRETTVIEVPDAR